MKISAFSFVRNAIKYDYPFLESIQSALPLCDELIIAVGEGEDATREKLIELNSPKIRIIDTKWDDNLRTDGEVLAQQTNVALDAISGEWGIYLQADEVIHEQDIPILREAIRQYHADEQVEGLLLKYYHFYGSYEYFGDSRRWYRREVRIIRNRSGIRSWGDAQGFRIGERKLRVKLVDAHIYHYGWVKSPHNQQEKQMSFNRLWHSDKWIVDNVGSRKEYDYSQGGKLQRFQGTHPKIMTERIAAQDWKFQLDPVRIIVPLKERVLDWIESQTGHRIGEYKNYTLI